MKKINIKYLLNRLLALCAVFTMVSCDTEFPNPNSPTDLQIINSREGLLNLSVGIRQVYSTSTLRFIIETPAITTREGGITTTFLNMVELEDGASALPNFNSNVEGLWANLLRVNGMCDNLIEGASNVQLAEGTRSGMIAYGHLFKAMCIGSMAQNYEQVIINTSLDNQASFVSRADGYAEAIRLLTEANTLLTNTPVSTEFETTILGGQINLPNTIKAILARYHLFAGNYDNAITFANQVDISIASQFTYDNLNQNPVWGRVFQNNNPNFKPRDNFGLPASFVFDANDGRLDFYLTDLDDDNQNGLAIEDLKGFFQTNNAPIPVYLPGEMSLIMAEANVRKAAPDLAAAVNAINAVRTKNNDIFGVNANIAAYSGATTAEALLLEIYQNRRAELFLTGMSLEDSRRFNRPQPTNTPQTFTDERNRNFYPYPVTERNNNPNTPTDPNI